jgi:hypothetical protein
VLRFRRACMLLVVQHDNNTVFDNRKLKNEQRTTILIVAVSLTLQIECDGRAGLTRMCLPSWLKCTSSCRRPFLRSTSPRRLRSQSKEIAARKATTSIAESILYFKFSGIKSSLSNSGQSDGSTVLTYCSISLAIAVLKAEKVL